MIASVKDILTEAKKGGYAVGAFNTINLETTKAIVEAAQETHSPVVIQVTEKTLEYAGGRMIYNIIRNQAEFYAPEVPIGLHLDHGKSLEIIERVVAIGFTSVMYDGSRKKYADNLEVTRKVVDFCKEKGVDVQGELGSVPYIGEATGVQEVDWDQYMTDPAQAADFVKETGIDALAVAIGNAHGFFQERPTPDYERLAAINETCNGMPLVLHGASDWEDGRAKEVIAKGICCFNVDTAIRVAFINSIINSTKNQGREISFDVRNLLGSAEEAVKEAVKKKIRLFGSEGKI